MSDTVGASGGSPAASGPTQPAVEVLRLATAYQASRALHVAIRMGLPDLLADGPRSAEDLARDTGSHAPSLPRLLRALAAYGVFSEAADGRFALGPLGAALRADAPGSVRALAQMWGDEDYWLTWAELERCVRTGRTAAEHLFGIELVRGCQRSRACASLLKPPEEAAVVSARASPGHPRSVPS